jgi:hypothetical protein
MCGTGRFENGEIYLGYYGDTLYLDGEEFDDTCLDEMKIALGKKTKKELIEMFSEIIKTGSEE